jgi:hypothetical protein
MNPKVTFLAIVLLSASVLSKGQVNEIKSASEGVRSVEVDPAVPADL